MTRPRGVPLLIAMVGAWLATAASAASLAWKVHQFDDGNADSHWGMSASSHEVLGKTVPLDVEPAKIRAAMLRYEIAAAPYNYATKRYHNKPDHGVEWQNVVIKVNGQPVACASAMELVTKGWHRIDVPPHTLRKGDNLITFSWEGKSSGAFYLAIDTNSARRKSCSSSDGGKNYTFDSLRPNKAPDPAWQGEYLARLHVAVREPTFADDFNRSDVLGPDWMRASGQWDVRGNLRACGPNALMMCTRRLRTPFRIEYGCYSDRPGDLSIELRRKLDGKPVCFVGFGAENNTRNKIIVPAEAPLALSKERLIEQGRQHAVVVEVGEDGAIRQSIDGHETLKATVQTLPKQLYFGLYVWREGVFNSVKVFAAQAQEVATKAARQPLKALPPVRQFSSFNERPLGPVQGEAAGSARIVDVPTWVYCFRKFSDGRYRTYDENEDPSVPEPKPATVTNKGARFRSDPCVELLSENPGSDARARFALPVPPMVSGLVELDLMAHGANAGMEVRLAEKVGLLIDGKGEFSWQAGDDRIKLMDRVHLYPSLGGKTRFYLQPQRWLTLRIDFDLATSLANVSVVKLFNGIECRQTEFLPIGEDLPFPADAVKELALETSGPGRFFVDNVFMISRTEDLANAEKWQVPAREIRPAYYALRKDPVHLKTWSMRNIRFMEGSGCPAGDELYHGDLYHSPDRYAVLLGCAEEYNQIMVRQAFLAEKMRGLERAWHYAGSLAPDHAPGVTRARQASTRSETLLAALYEFYADCYLHRLDQARLREGFDPRHRKLDAAIDTTEALIGEVIQGLRTEVTKRSGLPFTPYPIESAGEVPTTRLTFSDGAFRHDGRRDFMFVKCNYLLWPSMERTLLFSPVCPLGAQHALRDTTDSQYVNPSTETYFHRVLTKRPQAQVALKVFYGLHNHKSMLPTWWAEEHEGAPDVYLQNSRGEGHIEPGTIRQFNYWNVDVLAAQRATLESLGDLVCKFGSGDRVAFIDMAQEAYFKITAPGGTWETGHNPSSVKAFRERLRAKYKTIAALNTAWQSEYASFDEIRPPEDWRLRPERTPGLTYEFERFRHDSWGAWLKQCHAWLRDRLPGKSVPSSCDISYPLLSSTCVNGLDSLKLFETFDIVMEHYQLRFAPDTSVYRYLENLRAVYQASTGIGEWYVAGPGDLFDEQASRNDGLRQAYQQVQWGRSALVYWLGHNFCFLHGGNWTENRLGHTVLRYYSAYIPLGIARAKAHRAIYLECPLVQPDVGILESGSSFYNVCNVRGGLSEFSSLLFSKCHDYGFLFERLIMEGRQDLSPYKVVILPNALCLPDAFVEKLLGWVETGGVLMTTGAVGAMNEYGVVSGTMLGKVLGPGQWSCEKEALGVKDDAPGISVLASDTRQRPALIGKAYGNGQVYLRLNPVKDELLYEIIARCAPRTFYAKDGRFHLALREDRDGRRSLYLSVLNPDCYQTLEDEIVLRGQFGDIADITCNFPIKPVLKDGDTRFSVRLAPAEGVMVRVRK